MQTIEEIQLKKKLINTELEYLKANSNDFKRIKELQKEKTKCTRTISMLRFRLKNKSQDNK